MPTNDSTEPASVTRARAFVGRGRFLQGAGGRDPKGYRRRAVRREARVLRRSARPRANLESRDGASP